MIKVRSKYFVMYGSMLLMVLLLQPLGPTLWAQESGNPFEIKPRLGQMPESTGPAAADIPTGNPFDIIAPEKADPATQEAVEAKRELQGPDILKAPDSFNGFIIGLILFSLLMITILVTLFRTYFQKIFRSILNDKMLSQSYREYEQGRTLPYRVLYAMFMINGGIFLFLLFRRVYKIEVDYNNWQLLFTCIGLVAAVFIFKHLLLSLISAIFPLEKEIGLYHFTIYVFSIFIGIGLLVANVALGLGTEKLLSGIAIAALIFIAFIYLVRSIRALLIGSRFIPLHIFHFLLYICTAEIAPVLVLGKLILNQLE